MRFCKKHWDEMKAAIEAQGLSHLIAADGKEALENVKTELEGGNPPFDPLMGSHNQLLNIALQFIGPSLMMVKPDGSHRCPVCELQSIDWIGNVAAGARYYAEQEKLVEPRPKETIQ